MTVAATPGKPAETVIFVNGKTAHAIQFCAEPPAGAIPGRDTARCVCGFRVSSLNGMPELSAATHIEFILKSLGEVTGNGWDLP